MSQSLYERLGAANGITKIVNNFVDRHVANPLIAPRFQGKDLAKAKRLGAQFMCLGAGGPQAYEGRDLRTTHTGMNISEQEFMAAIDDIIAAMQDNKVGQSEQNEVVGILYSLRGEVMRL